MVAVAAAIGSCFSIFISSKSRKWLHFTPHTYRSDSKRYWWCFEDWDLPYKTCCQTKCVVADTAEDYGRMAIATQLED